MNKFVSMCAALGILLGTLSPSLANSGDSMLIVPGKSLGKMALGPSGMEVLKRFGKPDIQDAGMMQTRQVWRGKGNGNATLFIHTTANGAIDAKPETGITIDEARTSSGSFHTASGIAVGSMLTQVRQVFPQARREREPSHTVLYSDPHTGIAFEFAGDKAAARCVGITVFTPRKGSAVSSKNVSWLNK